MPPLLAEGDNLGTRHRSLNDRVNTIIKASPTADEIIKLPEESDVDKIIKIDIIAKSSDNFALIEQILCSDDMLLVSRAIKKSKWLANDARVTLQYLRTNLFPRMSTKAISKLLLSIRLNTTDENKADEFYKYLVDKNEVAHAAKWLPLCSSQVIETAIKERIKSINVNLFKRICRKHPHILNSFVESCKNYRLEEYLKKVSFLLRTNTNEYLNVIESKLYYNSHMFKFNASETSFLMKTEYDRVMNKIEIYKTKLHMPTVAREVGKEKVKDLIVLWSQNEKMKEWFQMKKLKPFLEVMPIEGKFEFIKKVFIDRVAKESDDNDEYSIHDMIDVRRSLLCSASYRTSSSNVYQWYIYAPFSQAFGDMKKLIRSESSPDERMAILKVLVICCRNNSHNINALIDYFMERHMNEPSKFKLNFVTNLINYTDIHKYDESTWNKLNEILHSLEIYTEASSDSTTVEAIVIYKLLNNLPIPEVISKKFKQYNCTFSNWTKKKSLAESQKDIIFNYVFELKFNSLASQPLNSKENCQKVLTDIEGILDILKLWNKNISEYPQILEKIREVVSANEAQTWDAQLVNIYEKNKKWKRAMFAESILMTRNEEVCLNILKHDPNLLTKHDQNLRKMTKTVNFKLDRLLSKVRIYFNNDLHKEMLLIYKDGLIACASEHICYKPVTRGICNLLDRDQFRDFIQTYVPTEFKVKWSEVDMGLVSIQKGLAQQMYVVRPTIDIPTIMKFAEGDYLQHALPSLISVFQRKSQNDSKESLSILLQGPISLQKLGVRMAFKKLDPDVATNVFMNIWENNKNKSLRSVIFHRTFDLLKSSKETEKIDYQWDLLKKYISTLTAEEDKKVYLLLSQADKVPEKVRAEFCKISYEFLKELPKKLNCESLMYSVFNQVTDHIVNVDPAWVESVLMQFATDIISGSCEANQLKAYKRVSSAYIIRSPTQESMVDKYNRIVKPYIAHVIEIWINRNKNSKRHEIHSFIEMLTSEAKNSIIHKIYADPSKIFEILKEELSKVEMGKSYQYICALNFAIAMCESSKTIDIDMEETKAVATITEEQYNLFWDQISHDFCKRCVEIFNSDVSKYFPSIYRVFSQSLEMFLFRSISREVGTEVVEAFMVNKENILNYLVAIQLVPSDVKYTKSTAKKFAHIMKELRDHEALEVQLHYYRKFEDYKYEDADFTDED